MTDNLNHWDNANRINLQLGVNIVLRNKKEMVPEGAKAAEAPKIEPPKK
jgi:hypothetical protein